MSLEASLDTNILLRHIFDDVPSQCAKVKKLFADGDQTLHVSDMVVSEIIYNLKTHKVPRSNTVAILKRIATMPNVVVSKFITDTVLPFYESHPALSFVDCYAAFEAEKSHAEPLYTFDQKLATQHSSAKRL